MNSKASRKLLKIADAMIDSLDPSSMPTRSQASYVLPNPDNSRKNCKNCWKWIDNDRCIEHKPSQPTNADDICNLHVFGDVGVYTTYDASELRKSHNIKPYTPIESGLVNAPDGTSCNNCKNSYKGRCLGVQDQGELLKIDSLGCCNFWSPIK